VPTSKRRDLAEDELFTTEMASELRLLLRAPANYSSLATRFAKAQVVLGNLEGNWQRSF